MPELFEIETPNTFVIRMSDGNFVGVDDASGFWVDRDFDGATKFLNAAKAFQYVHGMKANGERRWLSVLEVKRLTVECVVINEPAGK